MKDTSTFSIKWLRAISHLSRRMQNRIIADVTRWQLTGEIPEKMSAMRRALFNSFILELDPQSLIVVGSSRHLWRPCTVIDKLFLPYDANPVRNETERYLTPFRTVRR